jgi:linoleoyl-CoA desaturase
MLMRRGGIKDNVTITAVSTFSTELVARVRTHLSEDILQRGRAQLHRKAVVIILWYIASYALILFTGNWIVGPVACLSLALSMVAVGFNIQHDANHNAFFHNRGSRRLTLANRIAGFSIHAIGGDSKRWIDGHVNQHHVAPNVVGKDYDIELAPFARLAPSQRRRGFHAFQHVYIWFVYTFTAASIIVGDVVGTVQESIAGDRKGRFPSVGDYAAMLGSKGVYAVVMIVVPLFFHPWWVVLLGSLFVLAVSGFLLGIVFQLAHVVEEADFRCSCEQAPVRWHEWQVLSSVDFCQGTGVVDRVFTWYCGGLNFQTEHHLFPDLPHTVYPDIAGIVGETCEEFGIRYQVQPNLRTAIRSHYRHVRDLGRPDVVDEARAA